VAEPSRSKIPRTADGKPNLSAPAPRVDGKPDLTGVWQAERTPVAEFVRLLGPVYPQLQIDFTDVTKNFVNVFWGLKPEEEPLRPEAAAILKERRARGQEFTAAYCLPASLPATISLLAFKMIQAPGEIVVVPGSDDPPRQIYTDGRSLPNDPDPSWTGHSWAHGRAIRWWSKRSASPPGRCSTDRGIRAAKACASPNVFGAATFGHIDFEISFDDPKYYTRPFGFTTTLTLLPDT
jgi:hypothetical protein